MLNGSLGRYRVGMVLSFGPSVDTQSMTVLSFGIGKISQFVVHIAKTLVGTGYFGMICPMHRALDTQDISENGVGLFVLTLFGKDGTDALHNRGDIGMMKAVSISVQSKSFAVEHHGAVKVSSLVVNASNHYQSACNGRILGPECRVIDSNGFLVTSHGFIKVGSFVVDSSNVVKNTRYLMVVGRSSIADGHVVGFAVVRHGQIQVSPFHVNAGNSRQHGSGGFPPHGCVAFLARGSQQSHGFLKELHGLFQVTSLGMDHSNHFQC
mmetsp:Transcript_24520/g.60118  ORF Transcript_24520/g.60118 Transcript_24520/m.60118 type:complete len:266 (+) Transcript_24520:235-1032(+)